VLNPEVGARQPGQPTLDTCRSSTSPQRPIPPREPPAERRTGSPCRSFPGYCPGGARSLDLAGNTLQLSVVRGCRVLPGQREGAGHRRPAPSSPLSLVRSIASLRRDHIDLCHAALSPRERANQHEHAHRAQQQGRTVALVAAGAPTGVRKLVDTARLIMECLRVEYSGPAASPVARIASTARLRPLWPTGGPHRVRWWQQNKGTDPLRPVPSSPL